MSIWKEICFWIKEYNNRNSNNSVSEEHDTTTLQTKVRFIIALLTISLDYVDEKSLFLGMYKLWNVNLLL